jgi:protein-S-isoprenylcysteine O-methyltransferase Ste14
MEQKILPVFQVAIAFAMILFFNRFFTAFNYQLPSKATICVFLIGLSVGVAFMAVYSFKQHKTTVNPTKPENTSVIVNTGIYAYSRNPMYLAMAVFLFSTALFCENILAFLPVPLFVWFIAKYQIEPEEKALALHFGEDYKQYLLHVRRWI